MQAKPFSSNLGFRLSIVGMVVALVGSFLPWYQNPKVSGNAFELVATTGPLLPYLAIGLTLVALVVTLVLLRNSDKQTVDASVYVRLLALFLAMVALGGLYRVLQGPDTKAPLAVVPLIGAWVCGVGLVVGLVGAILDYASVRAQRWTTVDLVLIVMCAALYGASLITLGFIRLVPGTWLRPGNALQAPFGMLFGIPGAIGIGLGNLLADLNQGGTPPHAMIMGILANFLTAFLPYLFVSNAALRTRRSVIEFVVWAVLIDAAVVAGSIWINVALGLTPQFVAAAFSPVVFLNNAIPTAILGPALLKLLYPFVVRSGLYRGREAAMDKSQAK